MRTRWFAMLAMAVLGCQSYEARRQEQVRLLVESARQASGPTLQAARREPAGPLPQQPARVEVTAPPTPAPAPSPLSAGSAPAPSAPSPLSAGSAPASSAPSPLSAGSAQASSAPSPLAGGSAPAPLALPPAAPSAPALPVAHEEPAGQVAATDKPAQLYQQAVQRFAVMDSYIARLRRTEEVNGKLQPEELALFKFRKEPWSVYLKWLGPEGKGREATYVKGRYDDKLHTKLAAGDVPLMPAGKIMSLDPNGYLVRSNSRHPITEAGIGALIDRFGTLVRDLPQTLSYQGTTRKPGFAQPLEEVLQTIPPGLDPQLPRGGTRRWFFDTQGGLPVMIVTWNDQRQMVESYAYEEIMFPVKLDDADFDPAVIWKKPT